MEEFERGGERDSMCWGHLIPNFKPGGPSLLVFLYGLWVVPAASGRHTPSHAAILEEIKRQ